MQVFVRFLKRQSPSQQLPHFGHGWIMNDKGDRWHPDNSQAELLAGLTTTRKKTSWATKLKASLSR